MNKGDTRVDREENTTSKSQDLCEVVLDLDWRVEEEDLGFGHIHLHARSLAKEVNDRFEA
jgi:hypothetical protein